MNTHDAVEIITRQADLGQIIGLEKPTREDVDETAEESRPQLVAVA